MNLLNQSAIILGLTALSIGAWTLYQDWKRKIALEWAALCLVISAWALSYGASDFIQSRVAYDIHRFLNLWIAPLGVAMLSRLLVHENLVVRVFKVISVVGSLALSVMVVFSYQSTYEKNQLFNAFVNFWPSIILIHFAYVVLQDVFLKKPVSLEFLGKSKRIFVYTGVFVTLTTCTFDHIPQMGETIPSIGNMVLTLYLVFVSQVIAPQKFLKIDALVSQFFATLISAVLMTLVFWTLVKFSHLTLPLFLLNSFLMSLAILVLWSPLVAALNWVAEQWLSKRYKVLEKKVQNWLEELRKETTLEEWTHHACMKLQVLLSADQVIVFWDDVTPMPFEIKNFFEKTKAVLVLDRNRLDSEMNQWLVQNERERMKALAYIMDSWNCDFIFPLRKSEELMGVVLVKTKEPLSRTSAVERLISGMEKDLDRILRVEKVRKKDRLAVMGELAAGLAHEIRNPLGAIDGAVSILSEQNEPSKWLQLIQEETQRLNRLVTQFLDLSQTHSDTSEKMDLSEVVHSTLKNLRPSLPKDIQLEVVGFESECWIQAVPDHVRQVLINLIQNAIEACAISSSAQPILVGKLNDGFYVRDHGPGMSDETQKKAFEPFFTTSGNGTGLGLSICERLVKQSHGSIEIMSKLGQGTEVRVRYGTRSNSDY